MNPIERIKKTVQHEKSDRLPFDLGEGLTGLTLPAYENFTDWLGLSKERKSINRITTTVNPPKEVLRRIGSDLREVSLNPPRESEIEEIADNKYKDEWGIVRKKSGAGYYDIVEKEAPLRQLKEPSELKDYDWPRPTKNRFEGLSEKAKKIIDHGYAIKGGVSAGIFEMSFWMRGWANQYRDLAGNKERASAVMQSLLEVQKSFWEKFLAEIGDYITIAQLTEDLGMQDNLMISPDTFRDIVKPKIGELIDFIKTRAPSTYVMLHSDGAVYTLIEDFIDMGVDILNPLQPNAKGMDAKRIKENFGDRLCFHGAIDIQEALPFKEPEEVESYIKRQKQILGDGGGYIVAPAHAVQPEVPPENVCAFLEAVKE